MKWLVVLDPLDGLITKTDTSLAVITKARDRGIPVDTATIDKLYFEKNVWVIATEGSGQERRVALGDYSCILMRKEPPYDLSFHYATHLLSLSGTAVINSPQALRDYNEKLIALNFSEFMPPTIVSSDSEVIYSFLERNGDSVIKSLDSFQGRSVRMLAAEDHEIVRSYIGDCRQQVMVQQFQDRVYEGDKRVLLLGGKLLGAVLRKPKRGYHANFANSEALATDLAPREREIVERVGPWLRERGIHFVGLDLIGEQLTEINITCPTGIVQISELEGRDLADEIVTYLEKITGV